MANTNPTITLNANGLNTPIKRFLKRQTVTAHQKQDHAIFQLQVIHFEDTFRLKETEKDIPCYQGSREEIAILISERDSKTRIPKIPK